MLTDIAIKNAKPKEKPFKKGDGGGLYVEIRPNGSKLWMLKYRRPDGKETRIGLGMYPQVSILMARVERDKIKLRMRAEGIDPAAERRMSRLKRQQAHADNFEAVAREWHAKQKPSWRETHAAKVLRFLEVDVFPWLGSRPTSDIKSPELLAVARRVEARGAIEKSHRVVQISGQIFRYAVATGRAEHDPAAALRGALAKVNTKHHASITEPKAIGALLRAMETYKGGMVTRCALQFAPLVFARPGELRKAEWSEINLEAAEWRIAGEKMKMKEAHIVPLSAQAVAVLTEIQAVTGSGRYVFPSERTNKKPMSENTVNAALRALGYTKDQMTGHGFRSMASTRLHEMGYKHEIIERQLAHAERNKVSAAYNYAEYLPERRKMMQAWADYLDGVRIGNIAQINLNKAALLLAA